MRLDHHTPAVVRTVWSCPSMRLGSARLHAPASRRACLAAAAAPHRRHDQGARSFWHVYLRSLPAAYDTLLCWKPEEASALQLPAAVAAAGEARLACATAWRRARPALLSLGVGEGDREATGEAWRGARSGLSLATERGCCYICQAQCAR